VQTVCSAPSVDHPGTRPMLLHVMHFLRTGMLRIMMRNTACTVHGTVRACGGRGIRVAGGWKDKVSAVCLVCSAPSGDNPGTRPIQLRIMHFMRTGAWNAALHGHAHARIGRSGPSN